MGYDRCSEFCVVEIGPAQKSREKDASRIPTVKFYLPAAFLDTVLPKMVDFPQTPGWESESRSLRISLLVVLCVKKARETYLSTESQLRV